MIPLLFRGRLLIVSLAAVFTAVMLYWALQVRVDAGFEKQLPQGHPYVETFHKYREEFGGANTILISLSPKNHNLFSTEALQTLKALTDEAYYIPGVNRSQVQSLFTPNVRFIEIVDGGFAGGNIVPATYDGSPDAIAQVRQNVLKSPYVGRLVSNDLTSAMVILPLQADVDQLAIAAQLEEKIRKKYENASYSVEIIGFAKAVGEIAEGTKGVLLFLSFTIVLVAFCVNFFIRSWRMTLLALVCALTAVVWNLGTISWLGYGFDVMSILVPFLIFAIGISHSLQILNRTNIALEAGQPPRQAAETAMRAIFTTGLAALMTDTFGFATIYLIPIPMIRDLAVMASMGVGYLIICILCLLPLLLSFTVISPERVERLRRHRERQAKIWDTLSGLASPVASTVCVVIALIIFAISYQESYNLKIGDLHAGVPELRPTSRYNQDTQVITSKYGVGVDILTVFTQAHPNACIDHDIVEYVDDLQWTLENDPHVNSAISMPSLMKEVSASWAEGFPKWRGLSRNQEVLVQASGPIEASSGLRNGDSSTLPIYVFLKDHRAESIQSVIDRVEQYRKDHPNPNVEIYLASGNAGIMGAINQTIADAQYPIVFWIYLTTTILCLLLFRSIRATICVMVPLAIVSVIAYAIMAKLEIGLKSSSLPIVALGVGIGVDYGLYIFSQLHNRLMQGERLKPALRYTLECSGSAVMVTGLTLTVAVGTWILSDLQFQADMGVIFASMLILNLLGALHMGPALAYWLYRKERKKVHV